MRKSFCQIALCAALTACTSPDTSRAPWHSEPTHIECCLDIAHAGGKLHALPYTNSIEALRLNASKGRKVFELDMSLTADGHLVLAHDWDQFHGHAPDLATFKAQDLPYTPTDLAAFLRFLETECEACLFITDAKDEFWTFWTAFAKAVPRQLRQNRFIVQTYSIQEATRFGNSEPRQKQILTLYLQNDLSDQDLVALKKLPNLVAITMPINRVASWAGRVTSQLRLPVYTHAYPWMMERSVFLSFARAYGVRGYYMD